MEYNKIINCDCLQGKEGLYSLPYDLIDLTVTSPPYNLNIDYDEFDDSMGYEDYLVWLEYVFDGIYDKTKTGGRCVINIGDKENGKIPIHSDIIQFMHKIGWLYYTTIIWNKNTTSNRMSWGSWKSPSCPSFPTPFEYILVFAKETYKKEGSKDDITITKDEFIENSLSIWTMGPETRCPDHPAPFPIALPTRCIGMLSYRGDLVFDPFMGTGTTALAAVKLNRQYLGYEISPEYCKMATERIKVETDQLKLF